MFHDLELEKKNVREPEFSIDGEVENFRQEDGIRKKYRQLLDREGDWGKGKRRKTEMHGMRKNLMEEEDGIVEK